jgi:hypothetical protein
MFVNVPVLRTRASSGLGFRACGKELILPVGGPNRSIDEPVPGPPRRRGTLVARSLV